MTGRGHGKIILLGEHAVVHGRPALVAAIGRGVTARIVAPATALSVEVPSWGFAARAGDGSLAGSALDALVRAGDLPAAAHVVCEAEIPAGAGLGASSALGVAITRALLAKGSTSPSPALELRVERAAAAADEIFHGRASGVDAALATGGGIGRFLRGEGLRRFALPGRLDLVVIPTGAPHSTRTEVARVARLRESEPAHCERLLDAIAAIVEDGVAALADPSDGAIEHLGRLFDLAQGLLVALGVSAPVLDAACVGARAAGALGAKLTGAGGGGSVIAVPRRGDGVRLARELSALHPGSFVAPLGVERGEEAR